jgi:hypothetical protein
MMAEAQNCEAYLCHERLASESISASVMGNRFKGISAP